MSLEKILRESLEGALIDGRCRLFSSAGIPGAPGGFGGSGSSGGSGRSPLSPLAMQYISGINENLGVGSPSAQPSSSSYVSGFSSSVLEHIKSMSVPSPVVTPGSQGNGAMLDEVGKMYGSVGVPSPPMAPVPRLYDGYDSAPKEQYSVPSPALVPPIMARGSYGVASPVGLYRHEEITSPIFPEPFVPPVKLYGLNEEVLNFNGSTVGLIVPPKFQVPEFKTHDALEGIKRRVDILDQYGDRLSRQELRDYNHETIRQIERMDQPLRVLHLEGINSSGSMISKAKSEETAGYSIDIYEKGKVNLHVIGEPAEPNFHLDIGTTHRFKIFVEKEDGNNKRLKDMYPLFLNGKVRGK